MIGCLTVSSRMQFMLYYVLPEVVSRHSHHITRLYKVQAHNNAVCLSVCLSIYLW